MPKGQHPNLDEQGGFLSVCCQASHPWQAWNLPGADTPCWRSNLRYSKRKLFVLSNNVLLGDKIKQQTKEDHSTGL